RQSPGPDPPGRTGGHRGRALVTLVATPPLRLARLGPSVGPALGPSVGPALGPPLGPSVGPAVARGRRASCRGVRRHRLARAEPSRAGGGGDAGAGARGRGGARVPSQSARAVPGRRRSEEHTSELQSRFDLVCRLQPGTKNKVAIMQTATD